MSSLFFFSKLLSVKTRAAQKPLGRFVQKFLNPLGFGIPKQHTDRLNNPEGLSCIFRANDIQKWTERISSCFLKACLKTEWLVEDSSEFRGIQWQSCPPEHWSLVYPMNISCFWFLPRSAGFSFVILSKFWWEKCKSFNVELA